MTAIMSGIDFGGVFMIIVWIFVFLLIGGSITAMIIMFLVKKGQKKIIEINMMNKKLRIFSGRMKKRKNGVKQFWSGKIKRYLPEFQQKSIYLQKSKDTLILLKDNNGMYHSARIPTYKEIKKWYQTVYGIDISTQKDFQNLRDIYLLPSPHEDQDWLANQCAEADREFKIDHWWQSPTIAYIGVGFICFLMIVVTIILEKKF